VVEGIALSEIRRARPTLLAGLLLLAVAHGRAAQAITPGTVVWECDFEDSYCGMEEQSKIEPAHRSSFVAVARSGRRAVKLTTLPGDDQVHSSGAWERDDLELAPSPDYCNEGQDEWWAVSILFPDDYVVPRGLGAVLDFHTNASTGAPNFNLMSRPEGLRLQGDYGDMKNPTEYKAELGRVRRNVWYDFVFHMRWSSEQDGFMTAWLNGDQVLAHRGPTLYPGVSCYLKLANYHDAAGAPSSIIYDRLMRGTGARAVALTELWH
jgi:hypothetical protein